MIKGPAYRHGDALRGFTDRTFYGTSKNHRMDFFSGNKPAFPFRDTDKQFRIASEPDIQLNTVCCIGGDCIEGLTPQQCIDQGGYVIGEEDCSNVVCNSCCQLGHSERFVNIEISGLGGTVSAINLYAGVDGNGHGICGNCTFDLSELNQTISACACGFGNEFPRIEDINVCPVGNTFFGRKDASWASGVVANNDPNKQPGDPECLYYVLGYLGFMGFNGIDGQGGWQVQIAAYGTGYYDQPIEVWPVIPRTADSIFQDCVPTDPDGPSGGAVTGTHTCVIYRNSCGGADGIIAFNGLTKGTATVTWTDTPLNPDLPLEQGC